MPDDDKAPSANEFDCTGCGRHIFSFPMREPAPTVCAMCLWLDEFVADPVERAAIRARVG